MGAATTQAVVGVIEMNTFLDFGVLRAPNILNFGTGARAAIPVEARKYGTRVGIVVDPFFTNTPDFRAVLAALEDAGLTYRVYSGVIPELPLDSIDAAAAAFADFSPDAVLGYGGGSAIDLAKLVALKLSQPGDISRFYGQNKVRGPVLPVIAVPTTAGTGSEVTPVAVVSDLAYGMKMGVSDPALIPRVAIVDPELTVRAPQSVTAFSGIDALAHAIESYTARESAPDWNTPLPVAIGSNRLSAVFALEATRALDTSLVAAYEDGGNLEARRNNAYGATMAGIAFGNAGVHLGHAIQYPLGALTKTPHGMGTGLLLPYVMRACFTVRTERLAELGDVLAPLNAASVEARAEAGIRRVSEICASIGLPSSLREMGVAADQIDDIVEKSIGSTRLVGNTPFEVTFERVHEVVSRAYDGAER